MTGWSGHGHAHLRSLPKEPASYDTSLGSRALWTYCWLCKCYPNTSPFQGWQTISGQLYLIILLHPIQWRCMKSKILVVYTYHFMSEVCGSSSIVWYSLIFSAAYVRGHYIEKKAKNKYLVADLAVAWCGLLIFDIAVFLLTLWRSLRIRIVGNRNVTDILLRDGVFDPCFVLL